MKLTVFSWTSRDAMKLTVPLPGRLPHFYVDPCPEDGKIDYVDSAQSLSVSACPVPFARGHLYKALLRCHTYQCKSDYGINRLVVVKEVLTPSVTHKSFLTEAEALQI